MISPNVNITITGFDGNKAVDFSYCKEITIKKGWKSLTDTCVITLPRKLKLEGKNLVDFLRPGFGVQVYLGYNGRFNLEFSGYIARVEPNVPAVLHCEDEMWKLKQTSYKFSYKSVSLSQLISDIAPNYKTVTVGAELGPFRISNVSAAKVLEELRKNFGFSSWFVGTTLYVGLPYSLGRKTKHLYGFQMNIIDNEKLQYRTKQEAKVKVKAISIFPNNSRIEEKLGDEQGEEHTLHFYGLQKAELKARALQELDKLKYDGYKGKIRSFGFPFCLHGDIAEISDELYTERTGAYFIDEVEVECGLSGFKRTLTLGGKAS